MNNHCIGFLGGGEEQLRLVAWFVHSTNWEVHPIFLSGSELFPPQQELPDFRDVLWLCSVLVLPDPVCREGTILNTPLWPGKEVDAEQFLGLIGKGTLLLAGEMTPAFRQAAAQKEVAVTPLPRADSWEARRDSVLGAMRKALGQGAVG